MNLFRRPVPWQWFTVISVAVLGTLSGVQLTATGATTAATPVITQLSLGPAYAAAGDVRAQLEVTSTSCVNTSRLVIGARTSAGANVDFGGPSGVQVCPDGVTVTRTRTLPAGTYTVFGAYRLPGAASFTRLPSAVLKVGPAAPAPDPVPTPTPTETVTPTPTPTETTGTGPSWDAAGSWTKTFGDEFAGSTLDTAKWIPGWGAASGITGPVNTAETACYDSANVSVSGGYLHLKLEQRATVCRGNSHPLTGAHINSDGKFSFGPRAAVEYRAYFPASANGSVANWPALWDDGQSWPDDGENDTAEGLGGQLCTNWWGPSGDSGADCKGALTGWHTVGYSWSGGVIRWYFDGALVTTKSTSVTSPHYLIMQNTQGQWGGETLTPSDLLVDWVRVWK